MGWALLLGSARRPSWTQKHSSNPDACLEAIRSLMMKVDFLIKKKKKCFMFLSNCPVIDLAHLFYFF